MSRQNTHSFSPEERFVLDSISGKPLPFPDSGSVENAHIFATKNGLAPFLFHIYKEKKDQVPGELYALLKKEYLKSFVRNTKILAVWNEIKTLLEHNGIRAIPLKGIFLSQEIYKDIALRPMSDIDLLVIGQQEKAYELILDLDGTVHETQSEYDRKAGHDFPGITYKGVLIELHKTLFDMDLSYHIPNHIIGNNLQVYRQLTTLAPLYNLIYFCLHTHNTMRCGGIRLSWFLDLVLLDKSGYLITNTDNFNQTTDALGVKNIVTPILIKAEFLFRHKFDFLAARERSCLTPLEKQNFIQFILGSGQQNTDYSYRIALEKLKNAKGLMNKFVFIRSSLAKGGNNDFKSLFKRLVLVSGRTLGMMLRNRKAK